MELPVAPSWHPKKLLRMFGLGKPRTLNTLQVMREPKQPLQKVLASFIKSQGGSSLPSGPSQGEARCPALYLCLPFSPGHILR